MGAASKRRDAKSNGGPPMLGCHAARAGTGGSFESQPVDIPREMHRAPQGLNRRQAMSIYPSVTSSGSRRAALAAVLLAMGAGSARAGAQDLTEDRRIEIARRLQASSVQVFAGPATGSGFVATPEGWVVTNAHVAQGAREGGVAVRIGDRQPVRARVLAYDPSPALAVLEPVTPLGVAPLPLADSDRAQVGQNVLAFGSPFGLEGTLTQGIVSARRDLPGIGGGQVRGLIQTDATINPGNSGGPLVNSHGEVIGVNTAILSRTGGSQGIGFAVPSNYVRELLASVRGELARRRAGTPPPGPSDAIARAPGQVQLIPMAPEDSRPDPALPSGRVWLGLYGDDFRAGNFQGVQVRQVVPGGPAHRAGLLGSEDPPPAFVRQLGIPWTGHIILAVDGRAVRTMSELTRMLRRRRPGQRALVGVTIGPGVVSGETMVQLATPPRR